MRGAEGRYVRGGLGRGVRGGVGRGVMGGGGVHTLWRRARNGEAPLESHPGECEIGARLMRELTE